MLHKLLNISRDLIVMDTETTGTNTDTDRIVELGLQRWTPDGGMTKEWRSLVNPMMPIAQGAIDKHHITDAMVQACQECGGASKIQQDGGLLTDAFAEKYCSCAEFKPWPTFKHLAWPMAQKMVKVDFAGKNIRFDLRIFAKEMQRNGVDWSYKDSYIIDAERLEQLALPRTLGHLYEKYSGKPLEGAHGALTDARASAEVIQWQLEAHPGLPRDMKQLHDAQWPGWIDGSGKFRFVNGVPCFSQWGKFANRRMDDPAVGRVERGSSYWDFIIGADFPPDVKQLARDAKLGKFPKENQ